jgi:hypothetical protein
VSNAEGGSDRAEGESFGPLGIGGRMSTSLEVVVHRPAVFNAVEGDLSLIVVNPQEDTIVTDPVFLDSLEVFGRMLEGKS